VPFNLSRSSFLSLILFSPSPLHLTTPPDTFFFELPDLGEVAEIDIGHDNSGAGPAWHLDKLTVKDEAANKTWRFFHDNWIPEEGTKKTIITLRALSEAEGALAEYGNYRVLVTTSDVKGAGTDASVYLVMHGKAGTSSEKFKLDTAAVRIKKCFFFPSFFEDSRRLIFVVF
jgi:hypothetical protein